MFDVINVCCYCRLTLLFVLTCFLNNYNVITLMRHFSSTELFPLEAIFVHTFLF